MSIARTGLLGRLVALIFIVFMLSCGSNQQSADPAEDKAAQQVNPAEDWKLGVALWTFHTFNFVESLEKVDSAGLKLVEANTFHKTGPLLKDSLVGKLSDDGLRQLKQLADSKGMKVGSVYIGANADIEAWKREFEVARQLGVDFVTAEPPVSMWDSIDSLAGAFGVKVAIHEHWRGISAYWHPDSVLAAIEGHPNFKVCADLGHWPKSGVNPVEALKKLEGHVIAIHLKDIAAYDDPKLLDVPVGTGVVDFPAVFQELKRQNFRGNIYIERDAEDQPSNLPSVISTIQYYHSEVDKLK